MFMLRLRACRHARRSCADPASVCVICHLNNLIICNCILIPSRIVMTANVSAVLSVSNYLQKSGSTRVRLCD